MSMFLSWSGSDQEVDNFAEPSFCSGQVLSKKCVVMCCYVMNQCSYEVWCVVHVLSSCYADRIKIYVKLMSSCSAD
jgi:hypothetical protein